jgi:hypothetical protein
MPLWCYSFATPSGTLKIKTNSRSNSRSQNKNFIKPSLRRECPDLPLFQKPSAKVKIYINEKGDFGGKIKITVHIHFLTLFEVTILKESVLQTCCFGKIKHVNRNRKKC